MRDLFLGFTVLFLLTLPSYLTSCAKEKAPSQGSQNGNYDEVGESVKSRDGPSTAFQAIRKGKHFIVFNGRELKAYDGVLPPVLSPDGKKVAYGAQQGNQWFYVMDGQEGKRYDYVQYGYFGKDGRNFAYEAKNGNQWRIVINEVEGPLYEDAGAYDFTPDHQLYTATRNGKDIVIWKGVEGKPYDLVRDLTPSPSGKKLAYFATQNQNHFLVINGKETPQDYDVIFYLRWNPDESQLSYLGSRKDGKEEEVVVEGESGKKIR